MVWVVPNVAVSTWFCVLICTLQFGSAWEMNAFILTLVALVANQALPVDVRLKGSVHEAFAWTGESRLPPECPKPPAALIESIPTVFPGVGAQWIPGYWDYDSEESAWTWTTGTWRFPPAGHVWISGYWREVRPDRWQRVPGLWTSGQAGPVRLTYTQPPAQQPRQSPPPRAARGDNPDLVNIPGEWAMMGDRLLWTAPRRLAFPGGRGWSTGKLSWTPAGPLPVSGHPDQGPSTRGWVYAPVRAEPGTTFEPTWIWTSKAWVEAAWRDPAGHYRLGDYHATGWLETGVVSAIDGMRQRGDPFLEAQLRQSAEPRDVEQALWVLRERNLGRLPLPPRQLTPDNMAGQGWIEPAKGDATPDLVSRTETKRGKVFLEQAELRRVGEKAIKRLPSTIVVPSN